MSSMRWMACAPSAPSICTSSTLAGSGGHAHGDGSQEPSGCRPVGGDGSALLRPVAKLRLVRRGEVRNGARELKVAVGHVRDHEALAGRVRVGHARRKGRLRAADAAAQARRRRARARRPRVLERKQRGQ